MGQSYGHAARGRTGLNFSRHGCNTCRKTNVATRSLSSCIPKLVAYSQALRPYKSQEGDQQSRSRVISSRGHVSFRSAVAVAVTVASVTFLTCCRGRSDGLHGVCSYMGIAAVLIRLELHGVCSVAKTIQRLRLCRPSFQAKAEFSQRISN